MSSGIFRMTNGLLVTGTLGLGNGSFSQYGGEVRIGSLLSISGNYDDYNAQFRWSAAYQLNGGMLTMPGLSIGFRGDFSQAAGSNRINGALTLDRSSYQLSGGVLSVSNITVNPPGHLVLSDGTYTINARFSQFGGTNLVASTLTISDSYDCAGGFLSASNIVVNGSLTISSNAVLAN